MLSESFKEVSESAKNLLKRMLEVDPDKRITAQEALSHPYFKEDLEGKSLDYGVRLATLENFKVKKSENRVYEEIRKG